MVMSENKLIIKKKEEKELKRSLININKRINDDNSSAYSMI